MPLYEAGVEQVHAKLEGQLGDGEAAAGDGGGAALALLGGKATCSLVLQVSIRTLPCRTVPYLILPYLTLPYLTLP